MRVVPQMIRRVTDYEGNILEENFAELRDVIPLETARTMVDLMQEPIHPTSGPGTATKAQELKRPVAGKLERPTTSPTRGLSGIRPLL